MALPAGWPPRSASGRRSIRFYKAGTGTANFEDNAYLFSGNADANTYVPLPVVQPGSNAVVNIGSTPSGTGTNDVGAPVSMIWSNGIRVCNDGAGTIEFSFDGTNVHGKIAANQSVVFWNRYEAGIAVRGAGIAFHVEAW